MSSQTFGELRTARTRLLSEVDEAAFKRSYRIIDVFPPGCGFGVSGGLRCSLGAEHDGDLVGVTAVVTHGGLKGQERYTLLNK